MSTMEMGLIVVGTIVIAGLMLMWHRYRCCFQDKIISLVVATMPRNGAEEKFSSLLQDELTKKLRVWGATVFSNEHRKLSPSMYLPISFTLDVTDHHDSTNVKWQITCYDWPHQVGSCILPESIARGFLYDLAHQTAKWIGKDIRRMYKQRQIDLEKTVEVEQAKAMVKARVEEVTTEIS